MTKQLLINVLFVGGVALVLSGCGVKGDPLPPETAPRLGRGHPTFTKASRQLTPDFHSSKKRDIEKDEDEK